MTDQENLAHYRLLIQPRLYFFLMWLYRRRHGRCVTDVAKELVADARRKASDIQRIYSPPQSIPQPASETR